MNDNVNLMLGISIIGITTIICTILSIVTGEWAILLVSIIPNLMNY
ncbi:hypothetical protein ACFQ3N_19535 [Virgibacillus byunsanensis]|uniref:Uncharacterized protein n=1 Tax=Virgibacillus byunsanensis TaxID=570945 RepID=A0ABW3LRY1_9BACI